MKVLQRLVLLAGATLLAYATLPLFGIDITWLQSASLVALLQTIAFIVNLRDLDDEENVKVIVMQTVNDDKEGGG